MSNGYQDDRAPAGALPYFYGESADVAWVRAAHAVLAKRDSTQIGRGGDTVEILHATLRITDPRQRWVTSRRHAMNPAFAIAETFWILGGRDDAQFVNFWNPALPRYAGKAAVYHGAYGKRLRAAHGLDQIERALDALRAAPSSRQVVMQIWDPRTDFPSVDGSPASTDVPCNVCSILKIRSGRLEWMQIMRSNDIFRGTPYNIVQFTMLQEYMAGCLDVDLGDFVLVADSLHAYCSDFPQFSVASESFPPSQCRIALPRENAKAALVRCLDKLDDLSRPDLTEDRFLKIIRANDLPTGHADLLRVAAADSARRRQWPKLANQAIAACSDKLLRQLWANWARDRTSS